MKTMKERTEVETLARQKFYQQVPAGFIKEIDPSDKEWAHLIMNTANTIEELKVLLNEDSTDLIFFRNKEGNSKEHLLNTIKTSGASSSCRILWVNPKSTSEKKS
jgi:3-polyprenyl-4-hydroxybenzoate decarboxylase